MYFIDESLTFFKIHKSLSSQLRDLPNVRDLNVVTESLNRHVVLTDLLTYFMSNSQRISHLKLKLDS